jgi:uncharacterized iron-regulated membrane protein
MIVSQLQPVRVPSNTSRPQTSAPPAVAALPQPARKVWRKVWLNLHLYIGLLGGALFVLTSLTGSLLVFYKTIDEWMNPEQLVRTAGADLPLNQIVAAAQAAHPDWSVPDSLIFPLHEKDSFHAWFKVPSHGADRDDWRVVTIDPSSGRTLSDRQWGSYFVSFVYELHQGLLLGKVGESFVGILALFLLLSIATGLYLWWPASGKMRRALSFQGGGSPVRRQYDLHKLSGLGSALVLSLLAATGFYLEFPDAVISTVRWVSPVQDTSPQAEPHSDLRDGAAAILPDQAVAIARATLPDARVMWLGLPHDARDTFAVGLRQPGEVRQAGGQSEVWIDQYSGAVLRVQDWQHFTGGEMFLAWLFPLHNGEAFGLTGRWLVCVTGFMPLILYVTALRMWWLKRTARLRQRSR